MSVDMFEHRFRDELRKLPKFEPNDERDPRVWKAKFPAWRALFSAMCLFGHSTGYQLPSLDRFFRLCKIALTERHTGKIRFAQFFEDDLLPGMVQRVSAWYESGMAETYLYACLVEAVEDKSKAGVVLYDPRADWKLKADMIVIVQKKPIRVSAFAGDIDDRPRVEARREKIERIRKIHTMESAHWGNSELTAMPTLEIARTDSDMQVVNGIRLFSIASINRLLKSIYQETGVEKGWVFPRGRLH